MTRRDLLALPLLLVQPIRRDEVAEQIILPRSYVLTSGKLTETHDFGLGVFTVGKTTVMVPPDGVPNLRLRELNGRKVELVIREFL